MIILEKNHKKTQKTTKKIHVGNAIVIHNVLKKKIQS